MQSLFSNQPSNRSGTPALMALVMVIVMLLQLLNVAQAAVNHDAGYRAEIAASHCGPASETSSTSHMMADMAMDNADCHGEKTSYCSVEHCAQGSVLLMSSLPLYPAFPQTYGISLKPLAPDAPVFPLDQPPRPRQTL